MPQLASRDMRTVESMAPDALPETTDMRDGPHGAAKYMQIGSQATSALFESAIKGSGISNTRGLIILDLWARVGDTCQATSGGTHFVPWLFHSARGVVLLHGLSRAGTLASCLLGKNTLWVHLRMHT